MKTFQLMKALVVVSVLIFVSGVTLFGAPNATALQAGGSIAVPQKDEANKDEKESKPADKPEEEIKGSDKKGKFFFKKTCKECHGAGDDGGEVTPITKTIKQWERFFKKDKHGDEKLSETFDMEQLIHIKTFLINHAADSDQPETCG
jgi:cytochrome c5